MSLLILGTGHIGTATAVHLSPGMSVTTVGRRPFADLETARQHDLQAHGISYVSLDIFKPENHSSLRDLMADHKTILNTTEPTLIGPNEVQPSIEGTRQIMRLAAAEGFTTDTRKFLRIDSPPVNVAKRGRPGVYPEDREPRFDIRKHHPAFRTPYFASKLGCRQAALALLQSMNLSVVSVAPTAVLGRYGSHGKDEPLPNYFHNRIKPAIIPEVPVDMVPVTALAKGIEQAIMRGRIGQTYQLSGVHTTWADMFIKALEFAGKEDLPMTVPVINSLLGPVLLGDTAAMLAVDKLMQKFGIELPLIFRPMSPALNHMMGLRSSEKAQRELGYELPTWEDYEQAIKDYVIWHQEIGTIY